MEDMPVQDRGRIKEWRIGGGDGEEDLLRNPCGGFPAISHSPWPCQDIDSLEKVLVMLSGENS